MSTLEPAGSSLSPHPVPTERGPCSHGICASFRSMLRTFPLQLLLPLPVLVILFTLIRLFCGKYNYYSYWDSPFYFYIARTLYLFPRREPTFHRKYYACHFPLFPLVLRAVSTLTFSNYYVGGVITAALLSVALSFAFYKTLVLYKLVSSPITTVVLFCFVPHRLFLYRNICHSESLYLLCVCCALIALKQRKYWHILFCVLASLTRIEGVILTGAIGLTLLIRKDYFRAVATGVAFLTFPALLFLHYLLFGDFMAYFHHNGRLIHSVPFSYYFHAPIEEVVPAIVVFWLPALYGTYKLRRKSLVLFVFCVAYCVFVSLLHHQDFYRYGIPLSTFAVLCGLDEYLPYLKRHPQYRMMMVLAVGLLFLWTTIQFSMNNASDEYLVNVMTSRVDSRYAVGVVRDNWHQFLAELDGFRRR